MCGITRSMPHVDLALKICVGMLVSATLAVSEPVSSASSAAHGNAERGRAERGLGSARLPGASRSAFLPFEEGRLLALTNRERAVRGLPPLSLHVSLREAARAHARDMALWGYVGHVSRYGLGVRDRLALYLRPGGRIGENLAFVQTVEQGHLAFVASWAHRQNLLNPAFRRVGIGVATAGQAGIMIAEDFADVAGPRPQASPHQASPIQSDRSTSSASTAPVTVSRSGR
jgi:uncharacterized protein YkwD